MELSPSWEAANCAAIQKLPSILWNPKVHYRVHKSPGAGPTENTASYSFSIVVMGGCLAIALISFTCFPSNGCSSSRSLHNNGITRYNIYWVNLNTYRISKDKIFSFWPSRRKTTWVGPRNILVSYSKIKRGQKTGKTPLLRDYHVGRRGEQEGHLSQPHIYWSNTILALFVKCKHLNIPRPQKWKWPRPL
jgi:hypothetical protein